VIPASRFSVLADVRQYGVCLRAHATRGGATLAPAGDAVEQLALVGAGGVR
jgi:hypothetical protein